MLMTYFHNSICETLNIHVVITVSAHWCVVTHPDLEVLSRGVVTETVRP